MKRMLSIAICICLLIALFPTAAFGATTGNISSFKDVSSSKWYAPYIEYVTEKGLMVGTSATAFSPEMAVTRAQYVQVLYAMAGKPEASKETKFTDLKKGAFYENAVRWAAANGVTEGITKTTFGPDRKVTREQAATFFKAYAEKIAKVETTETDTLAAFPDKSSVSSYAITPMQWAVGAKLISGMKSGKQTLLAPKTTLTRAQLATMLKAFDEYLLSKADSNGGKENDKSDDNSGKTGDKVAPSEKPAPSKSVEPSKSPAPSESTKPSESLKPSESEPEAITLESLEKQEDEGNIEIFYNDSDDIRAIDGQFTDFKVKNENDAAALIRNGDEVFKDDVPAESTQISKQETKDEEYGDEIYYRYTPVINGVPVYGDEIIIMTDAEGNVEAMFSTYDMNSDKIDTTPTITKVQAEQIAISDMQVEYGDRETIDILFNINTDLFIVGEEHTLFYAVSFIYNEPEYDEIEGADAELEDLATDGLDPAGGMFYLINANGSNVGEINTKTDGYQSVETTYKVDAKDMMGRNQELRLPKIGSKYAFFDAENNIQVNKSVYAKYRHLFSGVQLDPGDYTMGDLYLAEKDKIESKAVSLLVNIQEANRGYEALGYSLYNALYIDRIAPSIIGVFNYGNNNGAGWNSFLQKMVFTRYDFYESSLDVVAHEFTHAVINHILGNWFTSFKDNLLGKKYPEFSALDESLSDIMGNLIEGKSDSGRWTIGEDRGLLLRKYQVIRDMSERHTYNEFGSDDPHINAQIFNYAAYTMMSDPRTSNIDNVGWETIFYKSFYNLEKDATFLDARYAIVATAKQLKHTKSEIEAIEDGFDAAGIEGESANKKNSSDDSDQDDDPDYINPKMVSIKSIPIKDMSSSIQGTYAVVKEDGSLWMWGANDKGFITQDNPILSSTGNIIGYESVKESPIKVMDGVKKVSLSGVTGTTIAVVKTDGSLWMWGYNHLGLVGNGTTENVMKPTKIMDDVIDVFCDGTSTAAIKSDGSLWMWGYNYYRQMGEGTDEEQTRPVCVMSGVKEAQPSESTCYILTNDGTIWVLGEMPEETAKRNWGTVYTKTPKLFMTGVSHLCSSTIGQGVMGAILENGDLMVWGNRPGAMTFGSKRTDLFDVKWKSPIKLLDNVVEAGLNDENGFAIDKDGNLWAWGETFDGNCGDGMSTNNKSYSADTSITDPHIVLHGIKHVDATEGGMAIDNEGSLLVWGHDAFFSLYYNKDALANGEYALPHKLFDAA